MTDYSDRNFKNLNKTLAVCIELESNLFFVIFDSFCRELFRLSNDVRINKITWETMKITHNYTLGQISKLDSSGQIKF